MRVADLANRDLTGKVSSAALTKLEEQTAHADEILAIASADSGKTLVVVTSEGVAVAYEKQDGWGHSYDELHSISLIGAGPTLFAPLRRDTRYRAVTLELADAERLAAAARPRIAARHEPGLEWWDSPLSDIGVAVWPAGLLVKPGSSELPERVWYSVSFVNTGVQIRTVRHPKNPSIYPGDLFTFIPWSAIHDVTVEGADQIERRPSVGAVLAFGVLGLGASKAIKRSYFIVADDQGDYVFERQDMLPLELSAFLAPVLRQMHHHAAQQLDPMQLILEEQRETNRLLGEILTSIRADQPEESEDHS